MKKIRSAHQSHSGKVSYESFSENPIWTVPQVAAYLDVCERTVWNLVKNKKLKSFKIGTRVKIRREDVELFINQQYAEVA